MKLTPDQLDKIRHADASNLIKKVKDGKTLTAAERKLLESFADEPPPAKDADLVTTTRLAQLFGVNRKSINQWRNERDDVPKKVGNKEPLNEWRSWFAANPSSGHSDGKPRKDRESLLCEKLEVEIAMKKIQLEVEAKTYLPAAEVFEAQGRCVSAMRAELMKFSSDLPPRIEGLTAAKMQAIIRAEIVAVLQRITDELNEIANA